MLLIGLATSDTIGKLAVLVASFALPLGTAAPTESEPPAAEGLATTENLEGLRASAAKTLKVCMKGDLGGPCKTWSIPDRKCYHIGSEYNDKVSSYEVKGGMYCFLFRDTGCKGGWHGSSGRVDWMGDFNKKTSSFQCNT
ncbi:hypothetical protein LZ30DRAFT_785944 [Colletotrichum cereale]|nr:hypothetical protein LZ30DRAFT_785944 [Colletotrichum cereale]